MTTEIVVIHGDEWRKPDIEEPIAWAKTKSWVKEKWSSPAVHWDHDHCQICWWKLHDSDTQEHGLGYHNRENDNWLCIECYDQFVHP